MVVSKALTNFCSCSQERSIPHRTLHHRKTATLSNRHQSHAVEQSSLVVLTSATLATLAVVCNSSCVLLESVYKVGMCITKVLLAFFKGLDFCACHLKVRLSELQFTFCNQACPEEQLLHWDATIHDLGILVCHHGQHALGLLNPLF
mgnify:CR=1 FL=1